jgi:hypothetical protein
MLHTNTEKLQKGVLRQIHQGWWCGSNGRQAVFFKLGYVYLYGIITEM